MGTAFFFAGVLRLIAAPFYLAGKHIHSKYLWLLLKGAVPGLLVGIGILRLLNRNAGSPLVIILLGTILMASSSVTFIRRIQNRRLPGKIHRWLPWLALPIGVESGFSSAGAGALGTVLLLNYSEMTPTQVVGTDLLFGLVLAVIGSAFHWTFGSISVPVLFQLLGRWDSRRSVWLLAGAQDSRNQAQDGCCHDCNFCRAAVNVGRLAQARRKTHCHQFHGYRARGYGQEQVEGAKSSACSSGAPFRRETMVIRDRLQECLLPLLLIFGFRRIQTGMLLPLRYTRSWNNLLLLLFKACPPEALLCVS